MEVDLLVDGGVAVVALTVVLLAPQELLDLRQPLVQRLVRKRGGRRIPHDDRFVGATGLFGAIVLRPLQKAVRLVWALLDIAGVDPAFVFDFNANDFGVVTQDEGEEFT